MPVQNLDQFKLCSANPSFRLQIIGGTMLVCLCKDASMGPHHRPAMLLSGASYELPRLEVKLQALTIISLHFGDPGSDWAKGPGPCL